METPRLLAFFLQVAQQSANLAEGYSTLRKGPALCSPIQGKEQEGGGLATYRRRPRGCRLEAGATFRSRLSSLGGLTLRSPPVPKRENPGQRYVILFVERGANSSLSGEDYL